MLNTIHDQPVEVHVGAIEVPAHVLVAFGATGDAPLKAGKPGVCRHPLARDGTSQRVGEAANMKFDAKRIGETVIVAA